MPTLSPISRMLGGYPRSSTYSSMYFRMFFCRSDNFFVDTIFFPSQPQPRRAFNQLEQAFEVNITTARRLCQFVVKHGRDKIHKPTRLVQVDGVASAGDHVQLTARQQRVHPRAMSAVTSI